MRSIERRFDKLQLKNPYWSSCICFVTAVTGQNFSKQSLHNWFNKLVEKTDYIKSEKKEVIAHLEELNNPSEEHKK